MYMRKILRRSGFWHYTKLRGLYPGTCAVVEEIIPTPCRTLWSNSDFGTPRPIQWDRCMLSYKHSARKSVNDVGCRCSSLLMTVFHRLFQCDTVWFALFAVKWMNTKQFHHTSLIIRKICGLLWPWEIWSGFESNHRNHIGLSSPLK